jgi:hypothetical protein
MVGTIILKIASNQVIRMLDILSLEIILVCILIFLAYTQDLDSLLVYDRAKIHIYIFFQCPLKEDIFHIHLI